MLVGGPDPDKQEPRAKKPGPLRKLRPFLQRIHLRSLAAYSILALGLALLILFLFHVAAAQRGSSAGFYEERLPYLALPVVLGMLVFQGHQAFGRRRSLLIAGGALAAALVSWAAVRSTGDHRLAQGLLLGVPALWLAAVGFARIRHAAMPPGTTRRVRRADAFLLLAALLDLLFWLNPPTVRLGLWTWTPTWPAQALFGALALLAVWGTVRLMAGAQGVRRGPVALLTGALGGFYIAPLLAAVGWLLARGQKHGRDRRAARVDPRARGRLHLVALHGVHFAIALALLGYAPSTYLKETHDFESRVGEGKDFEGFTVTLAGVGTDAPDLVPADTVAPRFAVQRPGAAPVEVTAALRWERMAGAHFPTPATARTWTGDLDLDVSAVHVAAGAACLGPSHPDGAWLERNRAGSPSRICGGDPIDAVRFRAASLPGLGILWLALAVGVGSMALLLATAGPATSRAARSAAPERAE